MLHYSSELSAMNNYTFFFGLKAKNRQAAPESNLTAVNLVSPGYHTVFL